MPNALPFPSHGVPVVGQPFTLVSVLIPVTAVVTCNCGGADTSVAIIGSVAAACQSCGRVFNAIFNPTTGQVQFQIAVPKTEVTS